MTDPSTLANKRLWLRAKDLTGANGSAVTSWPDQSGLGHDGAPVGTNPTVATASTPSGGKSVRFGGSGRFELGTVFNGPSRGVCTASSQFDSTNYAPKNAIDGVATVTTGNTWASSALPAWWQIQLPTAEAVTQYRMNPASQYPIAWTFAGSNDGTSWTTLDTRSGQTMTSGTWTSQFTFANATAYTYYRFNFTSANGTIVNLTEIELNGVANATAPTGAEVWVVVKSDGLGATSEGLWRFGQETTSYSSYYAYTGGTEIYEGFGLTDALNGHFTSTKDVTSWRLYRVSTNGTTWQALIDETSQLTLSGQAVAVTTTARLGGNQGYNFTGNIAEILVRTQVSTSGEIADLIGYFNFEHGLTIPGGNTYVPSSTFEGWGVPL